MNDDAPLTVGDFKEFCSEFARQLAATPPPQLSPPRTGDLVPADQIVGLYSEDLCEDGRTTMRLYDLRNGRTGSQSFQVGEEPGPIRYAD
jgi:hypothetical protein